MKALQREKNFCLPLTFHPVVPLPRKVTGASFQHSLSISRVDCEYLWSTQILRISCCGRGKHGILWKLCTMFWPTCKVASFSNPSFEHRMPELASSLFCLSLFPRPAAQTVESCTWIWDYHKITWVTTFPSYHFHSSLRLVSVSLSFFPPWKYLTFNKSLFILKVLSWRSLNMELAALQNREVSLFRMKLTH